MSFPCRIALASLLKIVILCSSKQSWFRLWVAVIHFKFFKVYRLFPVCSKNVKCVYHTYISQSDAFPMPTIIIKLYCKMSHCSQFDIDVYEAARCNCSCQILLLSDSRLLLTLKVLEINWQTLITWTDLRSLMSFPCRITLTGLLKIVI